MKVPWAAEVIGVTPEQTTRNIAHCKALCLPSISRYARPSLAVVGGGPSANDYMTELRGWAGDMWVSGSAFQWVLSIGIVNPTFFTIDQSPHLAIDGKNAKKAILATCCDPCVFDSLKDAKIEVFDLIESLPKVNHWSTTVTAAPRIAIEMGYRDITFYGCDSSFRENTHAYVTDKVDDAIIVKCGGHDFITRPSFLMQAEFMAQLLTKAPNVYKMKGDGLLEQMLRHDYDITHATNELAARILKRAA